MAHKRKPLPLILALPVLFFIVAAAQAEDILNFNQTTGLPTCAYGCKDIYSAKFGCESSSDFLSCFCGSEYLSDKPERWGCDDWCVTRAERDRVAIFLETTCGSIKVDGEDPAKDPAKDPSKPSTKESPVKDAAAEKSQTPDIKPATAPEAAEEGNASDPNKSKNWWRKNWPYLLLAFFLVIVSIFAIAIARPLRKWFRRQMIARRARHSGQGVPPYLEPSAPATFISSSGQKRQYSDALWPQTLYGHGDTWSGDRTSSSRRSESSYVSSGGLGSYSEVGTPKDPTPLPNPPPGPGIRTLFVTQVAGSGKLSTRQETWELKMREQHQETPGWFQRKLASWKSFGSRVGAKEYSVVNSDISRAV